MSPRNLIFMLCALVALGCGANDAPKADAAISGSGGSAGSGGNGGSGATAGSSGTGATSGSGGSGGSAGTGLDASMLLDASTADAANGRDAADGDASVPSNPPEGEVHIVKRMGDPSFDSVVTSPSPSTVTWLLDHFYRMEVFTTFFDNKTSFYPNGWVYSDSAAIYVGSSTAENHPDWILQDDNGDPVYLDWGCSNGTCPQYAADITNAAFRQSWIASLKTTLEKGYKGAWIDDVNLALRFSNGAQSVTAISPSTQTTITETVWADAVAVFMEQARSELGGYELLHNSIWYARPNRSADPFVQRQIMAADVINMEGGFASDGGLTGGTGEWSVAAKMAFADAVHAMGRWVVVDDFPDDDTEREYTLACYLLLSNGRDALGDFSMAPNTWWRGYDVNLGAALSARTRESNGVFRREFADGLVLMLEPGAANLTITLPQAYLDIDGVSVTSVSLSARHGAVLRRP